ncbi:hypothetical protein ABZ897_00700 [Nonomuraea sp. NPDC046802]|uniref:hypothetical protein n=1 Tax=Nonomuraea sp. NPDC046802 TaxID=3154919 RepID=UPI003409ECF7
MTASETREPWYAWCFSCGQMHRFVSGDETVNGAWCGGAWVRIGTGAERDCLAAKQVRFGMARFLDELPRDVQAEIDKEWEARHG